MCQPENHFSGVFKKPKGSSAITAIVFLVGIVILGILAFGATRQQSGRGQKPFVPQKAISVGTFKIDHYTKDSIGVTVTYRKDAAPSLQISAIQKTKDRILPTLKLDQGYHLIAYDKQQKIIASRAFVIPNTVQYDSFDGLADHGGSRTLSQVTFAQYIPFTSAIDSISILDPTGRIITTKTLALSQPLWQRLTATLTGIGNAINTTAHQLAPSAFAQDNSLVNDSQFTIAFVPTGYGNTKDDQSAQTTFHNDVSANLSRLKQIEPYKSLLGKVTVRTLDIADVCPHIPAPQNSDQVYANCDLFSAQNQAKNALGYTPTILVIMANYQAMTWSYVNAWNEVAVVKSKGAPSSLAHELGHALGKLIDEYTSSDYGTDPAIPKPGTLIENCWRGTLPADWQGLESNDNAQRGCGYYNWYRTTETSLMQNVYDLMSYNKISEYFVRSWLNFYLGRGQQPKEATERLKLYPDKPNLGGDTSNPPSTNNGSGNGNTGGSGSNTGKPNQVACQLPSIANPGASDNINTFSITGLAFVENQDQAFDFSQRYKGCATLVLKKDDTTLATVQTDPNDGTYGFAGVQKGNYQLEIRMPQNTTLLSPPNPYSINVQSQITVNLAIKPN